MSLQIFQSGFFCFFHKFGIQIFVSCHKWNIHQRTVFFLHGSFEQLTFVQKIVQQFSFLFIFLFHRRKAAHLLQPLKHFSANIDSVCRRSVVERIRICMRFIFQHRRCAWKHIFCDQVFPDNHDHNTCRSDIFLYASIDHSIFCDIYRLREETGRNVCNQRLSFCIRQFFKFCSVNRIILTDVYIICIF